MLLAVLALIVPHGGNAQTVSEETVVTDSVDLFATTAGEKGKSRGLAMAAAIIMPGLGHQYLGKQERALGYFSVEALLLFGAIYSEKYSQKLYGDARTYAWKYAWTQGGPAPRDNYWQNIGYADDWQGYNRAQLNNRDTALYVGDNLKFAWPDGVRKQYQAKRENAARFHVASTFLIGAMALNRVVSFVDVRSSTRHRAIKTLSSARLCPSISSDLRMTGLTLSAQF